MTPKIERVTESITLGDAPHWNSATQSLYYVDVFGKTIHKYTPSTRGCTRASVGSKQVSFIIPVEHERDQFVISLAKEIVRISWDGESDGIKVIQKLCQVDNSPDKFHNRFNSAKCDPSGRLWAGTLNTLAESPLVYPPKGTLYSLDAEGNVSSHLANIRISTGIAFDPQLEKMYHIDSSKGVIDQYDLDINKGAISRGKPIFTLKKHHISGLPNGMTIDVDGNLWIAIFNGSTIIKIDPRTPEKLLDIIRMPVKQVISLTFGGRNLDELYVTTGAFQVNEEKLPSPDNGALYRITGIGVKGMPAVNIKLNSL